MARPVENTAEDILKIANAYVVSIVNGQILFPSVNGLSLLANVSKETIYVKARECKALSDALGKIKQYQKDKLIGNGLTKEWDPGFAKFLLSVNHGMHEKSQTELSGIVGTAAVEAKDLPGGNYAEFLKQQNKNTTS